MQLVKKSDLPVLVTSDSTTFLSEIRDLKNVYTIPGRVVHIDNAANEAGEVYMKSFVDFLMLSRAQCVYGMGTRNMYQTDFPRFAAKINNRSEEHTSELQSLMRISYAVFCLKKKKT